MYIRKIITNCGKCYKRGTWLARDNGTLWERGEDRDSASEKVVSEVSPKKHNLRENLRAEKKPVKRKVGMKFSRQEKEYLKHVEVCILCPG